MSSKNTIHISTLKQQSFLRHYAEWDDFYKVSRENPDKV